MESLRSTSSVEFFLVVATLTYAAVAIYDESEKVAVREENKDPAVVTLGGWGRSGNVKGHHEGHGHHGGHGHQGGHGSHNGHGYDAVRGGIKD
jgi:hypothetical protein